MGKDFSQSDCNFYELEHFFRKTAPIWLDDLIDVDAMLETLLEQKAAAFRTRAKRGFSYFGAEFRKDREGKGISRREIAERSGFSINQIERWENGDNEPSLKQRVKLTETLKRLP